MRATHLLGLCAVAVSKIAFAQPTSDARRHFEHGLEFAERADFDSAAQEFEAAYKLRPNYAVLYNLGQAYSALGKPIEAARAFETYLRDGGNKLNPKRQAEVQELVARAHKRIGYVKLKM